MDPNCIPKFIARRNGKSLGDYMHKGNNKERERIIGHGNSQIWTTHMHIISETKNFA